MTHLSTSLTLLRRSIAHGTMIMPTERYLVPMFLEHMEPRRRTSFDGYVPSSWRAPLHFRFDANIRSRILLLAVIAPATVPSSPTA